MTLQVPKHQYGNWVSLLKASAINHLVHKILRKLTEEQCQLLFSFVMRYFAYHKRLSMTVQVHLLKGVIDTPEHQGESSGF